MLEWILEEQFMDSVDSVVWPVVDLCEHGNNSEQMEIFVQLNKYSTSIWR